jgi:hypothetical protein
MEILCKPRLRGGTAEICSLYIFTLNTFENQPLIPFSIEGSTPFP